jgi:AcrR family transcriptional regulator
MPKKAEPSPSHRIARAAIDLAAVRGWHALTMAEIATAAGMSLAELYRHVPSKADLLRIFAGMVDEAVLAEGPPDTEDSPRDRLFDLLMRRFDALNAHRDGITRLLRDLRYDVPALAGHREPLERSMRWMLEAGGLSASGLVGALKVRALGLIYLLVLRIWADDDSEDMARTMAALDRRLNQAEQFANTFEPGGRRGGDAGAGAARS